jgi:hypothetical protein
MILEVMLCMEVVGCPTICCAQGPNPAMSVADIADIADGLVSSERSRHSGVTGRGS